jgi:hypothetical protein
MAEKKAVGFPIINERIAEGIKKDANDNAIQRVVGKRVDAEVTRRADLLEKALDKYNNTQKELKKCVPDVTTYAIVEDPNGGEVGTPVKQAAYSEKRLKEKQALQKTVAELELAIMKAFNDGDYTKLQQLAGSGKSQGSESAE